MATHCEGLAGGDSEGAEGDAEALPSCEALAQVLAEGLAVKHCDGAPVRDGGAVNDVVNDAVNDALATAVGFGDVLADWLRVAPPPEAVARIDSDAVVDALCDAIDAVATADGSTEPLAGLCDAQPDGAALALNAALTEALSDTNDAVEAADGETEPHDERLGVAALEAAALGVGDAHGDALGDDASDDDAAKNDADAALEGDGDALPLSEALGAALRDALRDATMDDDALGDALELTDGDALCPRTNGVSAVHARSRRPSNPPPPNREAGMLELGVR